jgi:hypothetical protein
VRPSVLFVLEGGWGRGGVGRKGHGRNIIPFVNLKRPSPRLIFSHASYLDCNVGLQSPYPVFLFLCPGGRGVQGCGGGAWSVVPVGAASLASASQSTTQEPRRRDTSRTRDHQVRRNGILNLVFCPAGSVLQISISQNLHILLSCHHLSLPLPLYVAGVACVAVCCTPGSC